MTDLAKLHSDLTATFNELHKLRTQVKELEALVKVMGEKLAEKSKPEPTDQEQVTARLWGET